jgi:flagellar hook-associated protein 3 FlgL
MRIDSNMVPEMLAAIQNSEKSLQTTLQQVSTGKRVNLPSDDPSSAAAMVQNTLDTANTDQYTQNVSSTLSQVQTADSALSTVVTALTQAISLGTEAANGTNNASDLQSIAVQVRGIMSTVVSQANLSYQGKYLFAGTATDQVPYTEDSSSTTGYIYKGNDMVNSVRVGEDLSVQVNVPGNQIFSAASNNVLGALSSLTTALESGNSSSIAAAIPTITSALNFVSQQRVIYGNTESQLNTQDTYMQQETVSLSSQATTLIGVDMAAAATNLSQAETDNDATLAAAAKVLPNTLLNYLSTPR